MSSVHNHLSTVIILALAFYFSNLNDVLIQYINDILAHYLIQQIIYVAIIEQT